jgi:hypothetical protein
MERERSSIEQKCTARVRLLGPQDAEQKARAATRFPDNNDGKHFDSEAKYARNRNSFSLRNFNLLLLV